MTGEELPDRRRHGYKELEEKLDGHVVEIEHRLRRFFILGLTAFAIIGITSAVALAGFGFVLRAQSRTQDAIQHQRYRSWIKYCEDLNRRHERAIMRAISVMGKQQSAPIIVVLNEAIPFTPDCKQYARSRVEATF